MSFHQANGASITEYDGWLLPRHFGNIIAEYESIRAGVGFLDLSNRAVLEFTAPIVSLTCRD